MSYIQVDARGCGCGKTVNTIIPRVRENIKQNIRTLIVVPSKALQLEYSSYFKDNFTVINSDKGSIFDQYQNAKTSIVCMTHEGFIRTPDLEKMNWNLIIDEAINPYFSETFNNFDSAGRVSVDFSQLVEWKDPEVYTLTERPKVKEQPYFELEFSKSSPAATVNRRLWHKLTNPNLKVYCTWQVGNNLMSNARETTCLQFELNPSIIKGWSSVWIAAASFDKTFMAMWLRSNNVEYKVIHKFIPHKAKSIWHCPTDQFSWSKSFREKHPEIEGIFRDYCENNRLNRLIYNKNNDSDTAFIGGDQIGHNAHGLNEYRDRTDHAFMSAIKANPHFKNFVNERCGSDEKEFEFAFAGYMAYQLIMRTALRDPDNTTPVNLFFLDTEQMLGVMDLFHPDFTEVRFITAIKGNKSKPLTPAEKQKRYRGNSPKKEPLTNAEKQKLYRQRKKIQNG